MEGDRRENLQSCRQQNFNPLPPHGGRPACVPVHTHSSKISIHSLRMEGDPTLPPDGLEGCDFNPLPPHGGRHDNPYSIQPLISHFNPLPPHGGRLHDDDGRKYIVYFNPLPPHGGRLCVCWCFRWIVHFNPLPPHGGRHNGCHIGDPPLNISIHSLRMEGDAVDGSVEMCTFVFQSTPSAWRETSVWKASRA